MGDLRAGRGAFAMYRIGEYAQLRYAVRVQLHLIDEGPPVGADGAVRHGGHRNAAGSHGAMVFHQRLGWNTALGHAFVGGRFDEAVAQRKRAEPPRRK